jgi:hypothetical protein
MKNSRWGNLANQQSVTTTTICHKKKKCYYKTKIWSLFGGKEQDNDNWKECKETDQMKRYLSSIGYCSICNFLFKLVSLLKQP